MNSLVDIRSFLEATAYPGTRRGRPDLEHGHYPFVTVSREFGAGGRYFARTLLDKLDALSSPVLSGWQIFDRELCQKLVDDPSLRGSINALLTEEYHSEVESLILSLLKGTSSQPEAYRRLFEVIRTIATYGKVIIVGRGGACVTASLPRGVHLRLIGSEALRLRRANLRGVPQDEARRMVRRRDQDRAKLIFTHFRRDISDPTLYDTVWNTDRVSYELIAEATISLVLKRANR